jgi:hypothetical protein
MLCAVKAMWAPPRRFGSSASSEMARLRANGPT